MLSECQRLRFLTFRFLKSDFLRKIKYFLFSQCLFVK